MEQNTNEKRKTWIFQRVRLKDASQDCRRFFFWGRKFSFEIYRFHKETHARRQFNESHQAWMSSCLKELFFSINHSDNMSLASMFCFLGAGHWSKRARRFWIGLGCKQSRQNEVLQRGKHLGCKLCKETLFSCVDETNAQQKVPHGFASRFGLYGYTSCIHIDGFATSLWTSQWCYIEFVFWFRKDCLWKRKSTWHHRFGCLITWIITALQHVNRSQVPEFSLLSYYFQIHVVSALRFTTSLVSFDLLRLHVFAFM